MHPCSLTFWYFLINHLKIFASHFCSLMFLSWVFAFFLSSDIKWLFLNIFHDVKFVQNNKNMLARYSLPSLYSHIPCRFLYDVFVSFAFIAFHLLCFFTFNFHNFPVPQTRRAFKATKILSSTQAPVNRRKIFSIRGSTCSVHTL